MVTRREVLDRLGGGHGYEEAAASLGIRPGAAYLVATGLPADGSVALVEEDFDRPGAIRGRTQHLSNPPAVNPKVRSEVLDWVRGRAARDLAKREG